MRFFSMDSPIFKFLSLVYDLIILNVIYIITCIPLFTIGAATSALYRTMLDMRYDRDAGVTAYFRNFKKNFKQATPRFLICVGIGAVLLFDVWFTFSSQLPKSNILIPVFLVMLTVLLAVSSWVLALTGQFENTLKGTFKNAAILALQHLGTTILLLLRFLPAVLFFVSEWLFLITSIVYILIYYALVVYLAAGPMSRQFLKLMTPEEAAARTDGPEE